MTHPSELIVIPCCDTKEPGGSSLKWEAAASVVTGLSEENATALVAARRTLSQMPCRRRGEVLKVYEPGSDLGGAAESREPMLPAIYRYRGLIYGKGQRHLGSAYKHARGVEVIIVSALYGLLIAHEAIRNYNLTMKDQTTEGVSVREWWRRRQLGRLLLEFVTRKGFEKHLVHNFLSGEYADACVEFSNWKPPKSYHGRRTASLYDRHNDIVEVLARHRTGVKEGQGLGITNIA